MSEPKLQQHNLRHPKSLWVLSFSFALFMFSFGIIIPLLTLYLRQLGLGQSKSYELFAAVNALMWVVTLLGGYLAGKVNYKSVAAIGALFTLIGAAGLAAKSIWLIYLGLATYTVGYGFCTTAFFSLVGLTYKRNDPRRDSGFTMFYLLFNIGGGIGTFVGGYLSEHFGYHITFFFAVAAMIICLLSLSIFMPHLEIDEDYVFAKDKVDWNFKSSLVVFVFAALASYACYLLFEFLTLTNILLWALIIGSFIYLFIIIHKQSDKANKYKLIAFMIFVAFTGVYWTLYTLEPSALTVFIQQRVDKFILGIHIPAASFFGLDPFFVIVIGFFFSWLWRYLAKKNHDVSLATKFALSLLVAGIGFWIFMTSIFLTPTEQLVNPLWIVFGYVFLVTGELLLAPISMAMVGRLSPPGYDGMLMGMLNLFTGFGGLLAGYFAQLTVIPPHLTTAADNHIYIHAFFYIGLFSIVFGLIATGLIPFMKKFTRPKVTA